MTSGWEEVRAQFPALRDWTFLNTATFGQVPLCATRAMEAHLRRRDATACHDFLSWFDDHDRLRTKLGRLVNCQAADIAYLATASTALSVLLNGLDWRSGDEIITLLDEFPNQVYHPSVLQARGVRLKETALDNLEESVTERTRLVVLSTANYVTGLRPPLAGLADRLHHRGVLLALDATQTAGALHLDCAQVQPDFVAVDAYKWMLTPNGAGFAVFGPELRQRLAPQVIGWRSHKDWRQVDSLHHGAPEFVESAEKYEGGMLPSSLLYALEAVVDLMLDLGPVRIEQRVLNLADQVRSVLREHGAALLSDQGPHYDSPIVAARFPDRDAGALARRLKDHRVLVSARHGYLRVSTHFYNSEADVVALQAALTQVLRET